MKNSVLIWLSSTLAILLFVGCNPSLNSNALNPQFTNSAQPIDELPPTFEPTFEPAAEPIPETATPIKPPTEQLSQKTESSPSKINDAINGIVKKTIKSPKDNLKITSDASDFIKIAHSVMVNEGKSLGTACNFYVGRVLVRAGFKKESFVANDFDIYAKNNFDSYKAVDFKIDANHSDADELRKHLWSYPERTPFIAQWTRPNYYGHIAILERIGDSLVIYQASYGQHTPRRDLTKIEILLSSKRRAHLTIYSEFR